METKIRAGNSGIDVVVPSNYAVEGWVADTVRLLEGCPCEHGCPSCVQSPKCGNLNEPLDKAGGYGIQDHGVLIIERWEGSLTNIVGLPLYETATLLSSEGFPIHFGWLNAV